MDSDQAAQLLALGAATLGETGAAALSPRVRAAWAGARVAAPAWTVRLPEGDNLAVHVAVPLAPRGCVLVVEVQGDAERGFWGEVLTTAAQAQGISGLVIDGGVRDVVALAEHAFPVFATGVVLQGAQKAHGGDVGGPVVVAGVRVEPGDWVVGDADGVVVVPAGDLAAVLAAGSERAAKETQMMSELRAGATTVELLSLDPSSVSVA